MRVVNDKQQQGTDIPQVSFSEVVFWSLLCAIGYSSLFFAPLPVIVAHVRLTDPWSKLAALLGAVVGLLYFELPIWTVAFEFVFSLLAADLILREKGLWMVLFAPVAVVGTMAASGVALLSSQRAVPVPQFWTELVASWIAQMKVAVPETPIDWNVMTTLITEQGHFLFLGFLLVSLWISVGLISHMGALPAGHNLVSSQLRKKVSPKWFSAVFVALFALGMLKWPLSPWFIGFFRLVSAVMFVFGTCAISRVMSRRKLMGPVRSAIYVVSVLLGFYVVVGLGFVSAWAHSFLGEET